MDVEGGTNTPIDPRHYMYSYRFVEAGSDVNSELKN
jgi:hypothetical protein